MDVRPLDERIEALRRRPARAELAGAAGAAQGHRAWLDVLERTRGHNQQALDRQMAALRARAAALSTAPAALPTIAAVTARVSARLAAVDRARERLAHAQLRGFTGDQGTRLLAMARDLLGDPEAAAFAAEYPGLFAGGAR